MTIGVKRCFGLPDDPSAPIWHIKLGKCQIVISRLIVLLGLGAFSIFAVYYAVAKPYTIHHSFFERPQLESQNITSTWEEYMHYCSGEQIIEN